MPTNLTGNKIKDTYSQLLHIDGGPASVEKQVLSATGVGTAFFLGTTSGSIAGVRFSNNNIRAVSGTLTITDPAITGGSISGITPLAVTDGGTGGKTQAEARTGLGLGTMATQNSTAVAITGGTITGTSVAVPFGSVTDRAYAAFSDITDQTGNTTTPTAVLFGTTDVAGAGITVVSGSQLTFAAAGTYMVAPNLQLTNTDGNDHDVTIWLRLNGTNIARSATRITVPKATDGGNAFFQITAYVTVTAGQYVQVMWLPESTAVTLDHTAAAGVVPAIPSAIIVAERIA
jgi:hypothetical protein